MRRVPGAGQQQRLHRPVRATPRPRAVCAAVPYSSASPWTSRIGNGGCRRGTRRSARTGTPGRARRRSSPRRRCRRRGDSAPAPRADRPSHRRARAASMPVMRLILDEEMRRDQHQAAHPRVAYRLPACIAAIEAPSECPTRMRGRIARRVEHRRQHAAPRRACRRAGAAAPPGRSCRSPAANRRTRRTRSPAARRAGKSRHSATQPSPSCSSTRVGARAGPAPHQPVSSREPPILISPARIGAV